MIPNKCKKCKHYSKEKSKEIGKLACAETSMETIEFLMKAMREDFSECPGFEEANTENKYCEVCGTKLMTLTGIGYLSPDSEPYKNGEVEEISAEKTPQEQWNILALYCEGCMEIKQIFVNQ